VPPVKVLVVDDNADFRFLLRLQLELVPEIEIVGEAGDGIEALAAVAELVPDALVLDLMMPRMDGHEVITRLAASHPGVRIVAYSAVAGPRSQEHCDRYGVPLMRKSGDTKPLIEQLLTGASPGR
jgi:CheY-like chemotaxis protein